MGNVKRLSSSGCSPCSFALFALSERTPRTFGAFGGVRPVRSDDSPVVYPERKMTVAFGRTPRTPTPASAFFLGFLEKAIRISSWNLTTASPEQAEPSIFLFFAHCYVISNKWVEEAQGGT